MRLLNPLHYTENHRYTVYRDFSIGPVEASMLTGVYQPMIGAVAAGLYSLMLQDLPAERVGYSALELQRKLFAGLDLEPNEAGRKQLASCCSKLEAVGLLSTQLIEIVDTEEQVYEYRLFAPLKPVEFFRQEHLRLLLRDKVGERALEAIQQRFIADKPDELKDPYMLRKDISSQFHEVFSLSLSAVSADSALTYARPDAADEVNELPPPLPPVRYTYSHILPRVPKSSVNRRHFEQLEHHPEIIARINFIMDKYDLTLKEIGELLDMDGMFDFQGRLQEHRLEKEAEWMFVQRHKREEALNWGLVEQLGKAETESAAAQQTSVMEQEETGFEVPEPLKARYDQAAYNRILAQEPYTKVLELLVAPKISGFTKKLFSKLNLYLNIPDAVLNALIHHMRVNQLPWKEAYIEKVAASLQGEQIVTYEQAVRYFRKERAARAGLKQQGKASETSTRSYRSGKPESARQKPKLPVYQAPSGKLDEDEKKELERIVKYLEGQG